MGHDAMNDADINFHFRQVLTRVTETVWG